MFKESLVKKELPLEFSSSEKKNPPHRASIISPIDVKPLAKRSTVTPTHEASAPGQDEPPTISVDQQLQRRIKHSFAESHSAPATQADFYKVGKVIGKGAFGKVNLAIHKLSGKFVALKSINKQLMNEEVTKRKIFHEFNIMRITAHANIVKLLEQFDTPHHTVFVTEVCGGGDLLSYVRKRRRLREDVACHLFGQLIQGLEYCHSNKVLHRDIKLDNVLLTSTGTVKICDFGVSKLISDPKELIFEQCGTPAYIAPEVFANKGYCGFASDIWSAGVVLFTMLYGMVPFKAPNIKDLQQTVLKCSLDYKEDFGDPVSDEAISFLKSILVREPKERLTPRQMFAHKWMKQNSAQKVNVFTRAEREKIRSEFEYFQVKKDPDSTTVGDPFCGELLITTRNCELKNAST